MGSKSGLEFLAARIEELEAENKRLRARLASVTVPVPHMDDYQRLQQRVVELKGLHKTQQANIRAYQAKVAELEAENKRLREVESAARQYLAAWYGHDHLSEVDTRRRMLEALEAAEAAKEEP